jgi:hypothetical protein
MDEFVAIQNHRTPPSTCVTHLVFPGIIGAKAACFAVDIPSLYSLKTVSVVGSRQKPNANDG